MKNLEVFMRIHQWVFRYATAPPNSAKLIQNKYYDNYSIVYLNQTPEQFFETIDTEIGIQKIDLAEIERFQYLYMRYNSSTLRAFYELILPVYVGLREKGYYHYPDLTV